MSAGTASSSPSSSDTNSQSGTEVMDESIYTYLIPEQERTNVCYYLTDLWEEAAKKMGYTQNDIIVSFTHDWCGDLHKTFIKSILVRAIFYTGEMRLIDF